MKRIAVLAVVAVALAGCANVGDPDRRHAARAFLASQIAAYNAAGIDPFQLKPEELRYAVLACGTLAGLSTVVSPDAPELTAELTEWCALAVKAAAPAPVASPVPVPRPE